MVRRVKQHVPPSVKVLRFLDTKLIANRLQKLKRWRRLDNPWDLKPGDALDKPGSHVMLFLRFTPDRKAEVMESDVGARFVIIFNVSGDGTIQLLYPLSSDSNRPKSDTLNIRLRAKEPFGAEQIIAITSQEKMDDLVKTLSQLDQRRAPGQIIYILQRFAFADARIGSIGFFTTP
jgi:hypothetical protein